MKRNKKKPCTVLPVILSVGMCATTVGAVAAAVPTTAYAQNTTVATSPSATGSNQASDAQLPPVRDKLSFPDAKQIAGCEVYIDEANREYVIRPKNNASEGIISDDSSNIWTNDFIAMQTKLSGKDNPSIILKRDWPIRFDKRIYFYMRVKGDYNYLPLFKSIQPYTINMGDNVSIKFIKDMTNFFAQAHILDGLHHINGIEKWDTAHVTSMQNMFEDAHQLEGKLDLSRWNVSKNWHFDNMFSFVGNDNDSFVLNFSNKQFMNQTNVDYMFSSFHGVLIANNWTVADSNAQKNPIRELIEDKNFFLMYKKDDKWIDKSAHLLITDNPIILEKNKTKQYKYYKKVKVIYKTKDKEQSVELELPAVYDSRIDENGKLDASKPACSDPMKVVKPQIDEAIINAVREMRTKNPALNLPENVIPVPVHEVKDTDSPTALFQTYYLATVKEEVTKAKTTYTADPKLEYKKVEYDTQPQDGKKQVITGVMKDGAWDPDATSEKEITKVVNGKARVGNKKVETEEIRPGVIYQADSSLDYKKEQTTEGTEGTKTTTTIYKVDENKGLTEEVDGTPKVETTPAKDKVIKVGNVEKKTSDIACKKTYEGNEALTYKEQKTKTAGKNGKEEVTLTYKVDAKTGLTQEVEAKKGSCTKPVNEVIQVGNKEVIQNNDGSTTTKTYKVNPNDGTLSDPTVVTSRPWTDVTPVDQLEQTVTFKDGDNQVASVKVEKGKAISTDGLTDQSMPENPTKEKYTFKEWNTKQDGTGTPFNADTVVNNDLTVYAVYTKNAGTLPEPQPPVQNQKTVTFNKKDGSLLSTVKVETGKKVAVASMPTAPTEEGLTFKEWNTKQDGTGTAFNADTVVNNDLTVYAVYTKNAGTLPEPQPPVQNQKTVTFNKKDGSLLSTVKVETGKKVAVASMPTAPTEEGLTFKEWNTKQDGTGTAFNADTVVNNDLTVYAVYTKNAGTLPEPQPQPQPQPQQPTPSPIPAPTPAPALPTQPAQTLAPVRPLSAAPAPKHMRAAALPKTGEASSLGSLFATLGLSITGLGALHKKKTAQKGSHLSE